MFINELRAKELLLSPDKKIIIGQTSIKDEFDDICFSDFGFWARICTEHAQLNKYKKLGKIDCEYVGNTGALCDCRNCSNEADYYIDFFNDSSELRAIFDENI